MPAQPTLYQELFHTLWTVAPDPVPPSTVARLAALSTGIIAARSCVLKQVASELHSLALSVAQAESIERRLRRTLNDPHLSQEGLYQPLLRRLLDWDRLGGGDGPLVLVVDESSKAEEIHLFRLSLTFQGSAIPLAWASWAQNVAQPAGAYWAAVDRVFATVAALLPAGRDVVVVADRAYDIPPLLDRVAARGWHWVVRTKAQGATRFVDHQGRETALAAQVGQHLGRCGRRWKARGRAFKDAGWRAVSVVGHWAAGQEEPLVVLTDLPPQWQVLALYDRRFWTEPAFRSDKTRGWRWEATQVQGLAHQERLLVGMAVASVVTLCLGVQAGVEQLTRVAARPVRAGVPHGKPRHARDSLFTLGLARARTWLYQHLESLERWVLYELGSASWLRTWHAHQSYRFMIRCPVRP